jgi:hypothetical protein
MRLYVQPVTAFILVTALIAGSCNSGNKPADIEKDSIPSIKYDSPDINVHPVPGKDTSKNEFGFLREYHGKYPADVKLLEDPRLMPRLEKLLGNRFAFLKETWAVESPMEIRNNFFVASACMAHNCGSTNFIIIIDLLKNVVYAGIREDDKVKTYAEDYSSNAELDRWAGQ